MKTPEQKAAWAAYMREYNKKNRERLIERRRALASTPEAKLRKATYDLTYRKKKKEQGVYSTPEYLKHMAEIQAAYRLANPEKIKQIKRKYYASDKGKACKKREDAAYTASGGRALAEARRAQKPLSEARKEARKRWAQLNQVYYTADRVKRRSLEKNLDDDDFWILQEAVELARLREQIVGGSWHVDHVIPVSKGGTSHPSNLQVVPASWNLQKSNKHSEWFFTRA